MGIERPGRIYMSILPFDGSRSQGSTEQRLCDWMDGLVGFYLVWSISSSQWKIVVCNFILCNRERDQPCACGIFFSHALLSNRFDSKNSMSKREKDSCLS